MSKGINAEDLKKIVDKMVERYGKDIVFEFDGSIRIVDFDNNYKDCIR